VKLATPTGLIAPPTISSRSRQHADRSQATQRHGPAGRDPRGLTLVQIASHQGYATTPQRAVSRLHPGSRVCNPDLVRPEPLVGLAPDLVRLSCGIEDPADLADDLRQGLAGRTGRRPADRSSKAAKTSTGG